jgi:hypothetical protein
LNNFTLWLKDYINEHPETLEMMKKGSVPKVSAKKESKENIIDFQ